MLANERRFTHRGAPRGAGDHAIAEFAEMVEQPDYEPTVEFRFRHSNGGRHPIVLRQVDSRDSSTRTAAMVAQTAR